MGLILYFDTILVPLSLFLMLGYHAYLWHCFKYKPLSTSIGLDASKRKSWFLLLDEDIDKKGMLAVQSLRNTLMTTILTGTIAILINISLAALTNNTYKASTLFNSRFFGPQSGIILALRYGSSSLLLLCSFMCCSLSIGFLIDANFLMNADYSSSSTPYNSNYTRTIFEKGFMLALFGNRMLCMAFPCLLWLFGPIPVGLSSLGLIWGLYELDFGTVSSFKQSLT
ncbi:hypothetical protein ACFE04_002459 [Oxalis oulophora]